MTFSMVAEMCSIFDAEMCQYSMSMPNDEFCPNHRMNNA